MKYSTKVLTTAVESIFSIIEETPFVKVSVKQFLWGYEDTFLNLARDVLPPWQRLPYEKYGVFVKVPMTLIKVV